MELHRFDCMLMEILQERKTLPGFLEVVFGFLARNSDFYYEQKYMNDKIGLPPGMKEQIVLQVLQKFDPKYRFATEEAEVPPAIEEVEVVSDHIESSAEAEASQETPNETDSKKNSENDTPKEFFSASEYKNGACYDSHCWSQSSTEVELYIRLPEDLKSAKHLTTEIRADQIIVTSKIDPQAAPIFDGKLYAKCKHNDVLWTINEGKLQITFDKLRESWWDRLIDGEPSIDVTKIDCSKYIDELPEQSQAAMEKLRWEQQQSRPQSFKETDPEHAERLRQSWNLDGSPFKGKPFDPSTVTFH